MAVMASKFKHAQPQKTGAESMLLRKGPYDAKDELEDILFESFTSLHMQLKPPYQLHSMTAAEHAQLNQALLYGILTQQQSQQSYIMHLAAVTRDGYAGFVSILRRIVHELYLKLLDQPRRHLLWLVRQLISLAAAEVDTLCLSLMRCIGGGDMSDWNIWLTGQMLDVLRSNWSWLVEHSALLTGALFTFLRLLPDHFMSKSPIVSELRQDEVAFCVKILRDRFRDCLVIGRDLVRLLQDVACIPEFESVWRDLLSNPSAFNVVEFTDIAQLYVVCTPARYLTSRLTPDMEAQIRFMLTQVRMGSQLRYQAWFAQRFLSTPGSETLVCDLIRFICCAHHPSNQILQSDIVPRWAVLGWLLKCCKNHHIEANAKLALFYDWLFFMRKTDNLMNIEPALLLMVYSLPKYADMTQSLLEFLFFCMEHYDPQRKDLIWCGVIESVNVLVEKKVVTSLKPLSSSPCLALSLKKKLIECFPTYCHEPDKEAKGELSPKGKIGPVSGLGTQSPAPKKPEALTVSEVKCDLGGESFVDKRTVSGLLRQGKSESGGDSLGSKKQNIDMEKEGSYGGQEKVGGPDSVTDMESCDDILDMVPHKKRRMNMVTLDDFSNALQRLHNEAVDVFEKFLVSHLSDLEAMDAERNVKDLRKNDAESFETLAKRVSSIMKGSKFGFCAPLHGHSPNSLVEDEIMSVTSAVLRMYTQSAHPQLLQMLLSWHAEGFSVGARLLCYSCRLAEDANQSPQKTHENKLDMLPDKSRKTSKLSALSWHQEICHMANQKMGVYQRALELGGPVQAHPAVSMCFMAYKEFLKGLQNISGFVSKESPCNQLMSMSGQHEKYSSEGQVANDLQQWLIKDLETCLAWSIPRLLSILPLVFSHLPELSIGNEQVIKLLVSTVDPVEMAKIELKLSLKEILVFGESLACIQTAVKSSLSWDCFEQQYLWRLLIAEWQNPASLSLSEFVKLCALFLKPEQHHEAVSGLLSLLRRHWPTMHLVSAMLHLPQDFNRLVAAVLATWTLLDTSRLLGCLTALVTKRLKGKDVVPKGSVQHLPQADNSGGSALSTFLSFLDDQLRVGDNTDEQTKVEIKKIRNTALKLVDLLDSIPTAEAPGSPADK